MIVTRGEGETLPFREKELSAGKMQKGEVIARFLCPANQQATRAVEPRMRALHYPSSRTISGKADFLGFFLTSTTDVIEIAMRADQQAHHERIIGCIQAQVLGMLLIWLRA